jgi:PAS domain S-box-containing protein
MPQYLPLQQQNWKLATYILSGCCVLLGFTGLCGWLFDLAPLRNLLSDNASMKVNTALMLIGAGLSLGLFNKGKVNIARIFAIVVMIVSLLVLAENLLGVNLHVDELLWKDRFTNPTVDVPGRSSLLTCLAVSMIGGSLLFLTYRRFQAAQLIAFVMFIIVYIALMGHLFHISGFYHLGNYSGVAFHTALALSLLAIGVLTTAPDKGAIALVYGRLSRKNLLTYFLSYFLGAAPLFAAIYLFIIQHGKLSPSSDVIVLIAITAVLSLPVAYFLLRLVNGIEKELVQTTVKLEVALEAASLGTYEYYPDSGLMNCSTQCKQNFGLAADTPFNFIDLLKAILPAYRDVVQENIKKAIAGNYNYHSQYQVKWPEGTVRWISASGKPGYDKDGNIISVSGVTYDITEQVQAAERQQQLNEELAASNEELQTANEELQVTYEQLAGLHNTLIISEQKSRLLLDGAPVAVGVLDIENLNVVSANQKLLELWGADQTAIGKEATGLLPGPQAAQLQQAVRHLTESGSPKFEDEVKVTVNKNGTAETGYYNYIFFPVKNAASELTGIMVVASDVTSQVLGNLELERAEAKMKLAIEASNMGTWHIHPVTKALKYNQTLAKIFGYEDAEAMTYDQAIGQVTEDYRGPILSAIDAAIISGGDYDITYQQRRFNDGAVIWLRSFGKITQDTEGNYTVFSGLVMDVTEQKKDEERKNDFIGMVSHELKTPLTSLSAYIQMLLGKANLAGDSFTAGALDKANNQVKKMNSLINGFLNISRLESGKIQLLKHEFALDALLIEVVREIQVTFPGQLIRFNPDAVILVTADKDKIGTVITNLLSNAIKYSAKGKAIDISCSVVGNQVQVAVADQGMGIKIEDIPKLFDRFYRVQSPQMFSISGFGIGLYLSAEIIQRHGGSIWAESEPGIGSTFFFSIPVN